MALWTKISIQWGGPKYHVKYFSQFHCVSKMYPIKIFFLKKCEGDLWKFKIPWLFAKFIFSMTFPGLDLGQRWAKILNKKLICLGDAGEVPPPPPVNPLDLLSFLWPTERENTTLYTGVSCVPHRVWNSIWSWLRPYKIVGHYSVRSYLRLVLD